MPESVPSSLIIDAFKEIFQAERRGGKRQDPLGWIISVPDTHQKSVLAALDKERSLRVLTCSTEDDANAVAAGLYMTGEPVIVMIQHAGLYASVNTIRGISMDGKVPIFYMIGLLSREKDKDPEGLPALDGPLRRAAARRVRHSPRPDGGAGRREADSRILPEEPRAERPRRGPRRPGDRVMMKPEEILTLVAAARGSAICVPTMTTSPAWRTIAPDDLSVGCVGFMGGASAMGLGLALGAPDRRVIVFDGDGSLLMQLGSLATIAGAAPRNFTHLLFKNGVYHTSGSQETPGGQGVDFAAMAKAAGYRSTCTITSLDEFKKRLPGLLSDEGPIMAQLITGLAGSTPMNSPPGTPFPQQVANVRAKVTGGG